MDKDSCFCKNIRIVEGVFGEIPSGPPENDDDAAASTNKIKSYKMSNDCGMEVILITWGATIMSIKCPDKYGDLADVVLGYDKLDSYLDPKLSRMMGCVVGRCCGDLKTADSEEGVVAETSDHQQAHKVSGDFGRCIWESFIEDGCRVVMSCVSPDGEDGYPGALLVSVKFQLSRSNSLEIGMRAVSSKPTMVNLSHSCIFNLAGHASGPYEIRAHEVSLNCDRWIAREEDEATSQVADVVRPVGGTPMDLRLPQQLGRVIDKLSCCREIGHYLTLTRNVGSQAQMTFVARILHPRSGRSLEVYSDQPGVELYTGEQLPPYPSAASGARESRSSSSAAEKEEELGQAGSGECLNAADCECRTASSSSSLSRADESPQHLAGKCGAKYTRFGGFSLLPQNRPTAAKIPLLPSATLRPGQVYYHDLVYKFAVELGNSCSCAP